MHIESWHPAVRFFQLLGHARIELVQFLRRHFVQPLPKHTPRNHLLPCVQTVAKVFQCFLFGQQFIGKRQTFLIVHQGTIGFPNDHRMGRIAPQGILQFVRNRQGSRQNVRNHIGRHFLLVFCIVPISCRRLFPSLGSTTIGIGIQSNGMCAAAKTTRKTQTTTGLSQQSFLACLGVTVPLGTNFAIDHPRDFGMNRFTDKEMQTTFV